MKEKNKAIIYIICSAMCFTLMNVCVRLSGDLPSIQKSFFRNFIALIVSIIIIRKNGIKISCKKENRIFMFLRAFCGTIGLLCNFYAVDHLVLADASMLNKMSPFFAVVFSALFLKDKTSPFQIIAVIIAFIGSLFVIKPTFSNMELFPSLIGFLGGIGAGAAYTCVSKLGRGGEKGPVIVFFFSLFSCLVAVPSMIFDFEPMSLKQLVILVTAGIAAAGGQFSITAAYTHASAKEVSVFDYSQIIFSAVLGYFLFDQIPDAMSFIGYAVIISMAAAMFVYNNSIHKKTE